MWELVGISLSWWLFLIALSVYFVYSGVHFLTR